MVKIELVPGKRYLHQGQRIVLQRVLDLQYVLGEYEATGALDRFLISQLEPDTAIDQGSGKPAEQDLLAIPDEAWQKAQRKLDAIRPVLAARGDLAIVEEAAQAAGVTVNTLYRWLRAYDQTNSVRSLVDQPRTGGKGKSRLDASLDAIIQRALETYLTRQKLPVVKVIQQVRSQCQQAGLSVPSASTVRRRVDAISEERKMQGRWGKKAAREKFEPLKGSFPGADAPLAVVQIDHTLVDVILVDEVYRKPVGRPWLTVALDVYSRMVLGFYLSFDPPGAVGTGLCMAHAILPKEMWLSRMDVQGDWPCWGVPIKLHADNAKEFRGAMLQRACDTYGITIEWRPVATPHWGGHIESLMDTFMQEVHTLSGTTFSNVKERKGYDSEKKASLTLREFEQWLTLYIVDVYHKRIHQGLNQRPYDRYKEGIFGSPRQKGVGLPARLYDELQVYFDFMPAEERTVQEYGVVIDHVHYYHDVLRPYIHSLEQGSGKKRLKRKFIFRRDPRDISCLYFQDPESKVIHRIPYKDTSHPAISVWEFRYALEQVRKQGLETLDEQAIFKTYDKMRDLELAAVAKTKQLTKSRNRLIGGVPITGASIFFQTGSTFNNVVQVPVPAVVAEKQEVTPAAPRLKPTIVPFEGLHDDATFTS